MAHPSGSVALETTVALELGHKGGISVVPTMKVPVGTMCKNKLLYEKIPLSSLNGPTSERQ